MQECSEAEHQETVEESRTAEELHTAQEHIEADLHSEIGGLRAEIAELKEMFANRWEASR